MQFQTHITDNSIENMQNIQDDNFAHALKQSVKNKTFPICDKAVTKFTHCLVSPVVGKTITCEILKESKTYYEVQWFNGSLLFPKSTLSNGFNKIQGFVNVSTFKRN